jgi:hypothetical protein
MPTQTTPDVTEMITQTKQSTEAAKAQLLATFAFIPDDKLTWSPSETARTALWIVGHCGVSNSAFATVLRGEPLQVPSDPEEAVALIRAGGKEITTREAAIALVEESTAEVLRALDNVSSEQIESAPLTPFGPIPFSIWMTLPGEHMGGHARQIDYLQTIWGDVRDHM